MWERENSRWGDLGQILKRLAPRVVWISYDAYYVNTHSFWIKFLHTGCIKCKSIENVSWGKHLDLEKKIWTHMVLLQWNIYRCGCSAMLVVLQDRHGCITIYNVQWVKSFFSHFVNIMFPLTLLCFFATVVPSSFLDFPSKDKDKGKYIYRTQPKSTLDTSSGNYILPLQCPPFPPWPPSSPRNEKYGASWAILALDSGGYNFS